MQNINAIVKISGGVASFVDDSDNTKKPPAITIGVKTRLVLDLRRDWDEGTARLLPYPYEELSSLLSFYVAMDADWLQETEPKLLKTSGISLSQNAEGRTLLSVELPSLDTIPIMKDVNRETISLTTEVGGYLAEGSTAEVNFLMTFSVTIKNRIYLGGEVPPEVVNDPEYLRTAEIKALIAAATRPDPGPQGNKGDAGRGIISILKTASDGLVDTYTVTYTDGEEETFAVTNGQDGKGIISIEKTGTEDNVDTYTIRFTDDSTQLFTVVNGKDGQDLKLDATGEISELGAYDGENAGFTFAATADYPEKNYSQLIVYVKRSNEYGDWCPPLSITFYGRTPHDGENIALIEPLEFTSEGKENNEYLSFSLKDYPAADISGVYIDTAEGESRLPFDSALGIRKVIKKDGTVYLYFGSLCPAFETGRVYFSQGASGLTQYQWYLQNGGTLSFEEWYQGKGEAGSGIRIDATGTLAKRSEYAATGKGFAYGATDIYTDENGKTYTLLYIKHSAALDDWCEPIRLYLMDGRDGVDGIGIDGKDGENARLVPPLDYAAENSGVVDTDEITYARIVSNCLRIPVSAEAVSILNITVSTAEGEVILPYYSNDGILRIVKIANSEFLVYFGQNVPAFKTGRVYFGQGITGYTQYQYYLDNGGTLPFETWVNLKGIISNEKISTVKNVDTYRITYTDGSTQDYNITQGWSAYQLAVENGYEGTLEQWLKSLEAVDGVDGKSAYELARDKGFTGTLPEYLASLKGDAGQGLRIDATGLLSNLGAYAARPAGFAYATTDGLRDENGDGYTLLYIKQSDSKGDWCEPLRMYPINGKDGKDGKNAEAALPVIFASKHDDDHPDIPYINFGVLKINGVQPVAHIEIKNEDGTYTVLEVGAGCDVERISFNLLSSDTYIYFAEDFSAPFGGRIRFAQGIGCNNYCYVAYASDSEGKDFSLTPADELKYRAELITDLYIEKPELRDFAGMVWQYIAGRDGIDGDGIDYNYAGPLAERHVYDSAAKGFRYLATDRYTDEDGHDYQLMYEKHTDAQGDWTDGIILYFGKQGEQGKPFTFEDFTTEQLESLEGKPGKNGENALPVLDIEFLPEADPERPEMPFIDGGSVVISGTRPIAAVELYDEEGNGIVQHRGPRPGEVLIRTCYPEDHTVVYLGSLDADQYAHGGRIRFAQGIGAISPYQEYLLNGGTLAYEDWLTLTHFHENLSILNRLTVNRNNVLCMDGKPICKCTGDSEEPEPEPEAYMYYGYIPYEVSGDTIKVTEITSAMLADARSSIIKTDPMILFKESLGAVPAGSLVVVVIPYSAGMRAFKDNGFGERTGFAENAAENGTGANGSTVVIDGLPYDIYGEFKVSDGELFIYVDLK